MDSRLTAHDCIFLLSSVLGGDDTQQFSELARKQSWTENSETESDFSESEQHGGYECQFVEEEEVDTTDACTNQTEEVNTMAESVSSVVFDASSEDVQFVEEEEADTIDACTNETEEVNTMAESVSLVVLDTSSEDVKKCETTIISDQEGNLCERVDHEMDTEEEPAVRRNIHNFVVPYSTTLSNLFVNFPSIFSFHIGAPTTLGLFALPLLGSLSWFTSAALMGGPGRLQSS